MEEHGLSDERLRRLYGRALAGRGSTGRERCASPEDLRALALREGAEERRLATLDHVMGCNACRAELDLLRSLEAAGAEAARARPRRPLVWLAPIAVAVAASVLLFVGLRRETDVVRGSPPAIALRAPAEEVDASAPITFAWEPVAGASRYRLEILDEKGRVVVAETTAETSATVPAGRLAAAARYRWWVRAVGLERTSELRSLRTR